MCNVSITHVGIKQMPVQLLTREITIMTKRKEKSLKASTFHKNNNKLIQGSSKFYRVPHIEINNILKIVDIFTYFLLVEQL